MTISRLINWKLMNVICVQMFITMADDDGIDTDMIWCLLADC